MTSKPAVIDSSLGFVSINAPVSGNPLERIAGISDNDPENRRWELPSQVVNEPHHCEDADRTGSLLDWDS